MSQRIAGNAFWNLVSVGSGALVAIAVPPFLTRLLSPEAFGAWGLVLQVASYVTLFGFGMQTVVARHVAVAAASGRLEDRDELVATAFWILVGACVVAGAMVVTLALRIDWVFPEISLDLRPSAAAAVAIVGLALVFALPATVMAGVFIGLERNEVPALALTATRVVLATSVVLVAAHTGDLSWMAAAYGLATVAGALCVWVLWVWLVERPTVSVTRLSCRAALQLRDECLGLTVWSLSMLLISGLDLVIVGRVDYGMVPYFSVAATLVLFLGGAMQAISAAVLPLAARLSSNGSGDELSALVAITTRFSASIGLVSATPLIVSGTTVLGLWVGAEYGQKAAPILAILAIAGCIRLIALPYVIVAVSAGLQRRMLVTPMIEGVVNIVVSIVLGFRLGAIGVALGTLAGSIVGLGALFAQHSLREAMGGRTVRVYLLGSVWRVGRLLAIPVLALWLVPHEYRSSPLQLLLALALIATACWLFGLNADDRRLLLSRLVAARRGGGVR
jgi:O-antigen/teichoic acid export membrane protein